jgi:hypothetical protein
VPRAPSPYWSFIAQSACTSFDIHVGYPANIVQVLLALTNIPKTRMSSFNSMNFPLPSSELSAMLVAFSPQTLLLRRLPPQLPSQVVRLQSRHVSRTHRPGRPSRQSALDLQQTRLTSEAAPVTDHSLLRSSLMTPTMPQSSRICVPKLSLAFGTSAAR